MSEIQRLQHDIQQSLASLSYLQEEHTRATIKNSPERDGLFQAMQQNEERLMALEREHYRLQEAAKTAEQKRIDLMTNIGCLETRKEMLLNLFERTTRKRDRMALELEDIDEELNYLRQML